MSGIVDKDSVSSLEKNMSKCVENDTDTKIPLTGQIVTITLLLHKRQLQPSPGPNANHSPAEKEYILVSRAMEWNDPSSAKRNHNDSDNRKNVPGSKNEIIWGVNVLRRVPGCCNKVDLTTFTQANSSLVPNFLSHKVSLIFVYCLHMIYIHTNVYIHTCFKIISMAFLYFM